MTMASPLFHYWFYTACAYRGGQCRPMWRGLSSLDWPRSARTTPAPISFGEGGSSLGLRPIYKHHKLLSPFETRYSFLGGRLNMKFSSSREKSYRNSVSFLWPLLRFIPINNTTYLCCPNAWAQPLICLRHKMWK